MNPIRLKTHIDKYRVYTLYMPSMFRWFTLASTDNKSINTVEGLTEREAFENHLRISSFYLERFQAEEKVVEALKEIISASKKEVVEEEIEIEIPQEEMKDDDTKEET